MSADENRHKPSTKHTLEEVLQALQDLVRNELADTNVPTEPTPTPTPTPRARAPRNPGNEYASLASVSDLTPAVQATEAEKPTAPANKAESAPPVLTEVVVPGPGAPGSGKRGAGAKAGWKPPEQTSINWDDIPVLKDAVQPPPAPVTPDPIDAIAAAAVSRVVAELRKSGHLPLDPAIIERLETALRQALKELLAQPPTTQRR